MNMYTKENLFYYTRSRVLYCSPKEALREEDCDIRLQNPFDTFTQWYDLACQNPDKIAEPNAMCLSTVAQDGRPSSRYVLLKSYGKDQGLKFFTNYHSRKGCELAHNPFASVVFYWQPLQRSVRVEGVCEKLPAPESDKFFSTRYFESQISTVVSRQSEPVADRCTMDAMYQAEVERLKSADEDRPKRPEHWGGYRLIPDLFEFWQGQSNRFHDRFRFMSVGTYRTIEPTQDPGSESTIRSAEGEGEFSNETTDGAWVCQRLFP